MSVEQSIAFLRSLLSQPSGQVIYEDVIADVLGEVDRLQQQVEDTRTVVEAALCVCEARAEGLPYEARLDKLHDALVGRSR